ncbi:MAG: hypothetical protein ACOCXQ_03535 [Patescibacteria group bacterium]
MRKERKPQPPPDKDSQLSRLFNSIRLPKDKGRILNRPVTKAGERQPRLKPWDDMNTGEVPEHLLLEDLCAPLPEEPDPATCDAAEEAGIILAMALERDELHPSLVGMNCGTILHNMVQTAMEGRREQPTLNDYIKDHVPDHWLRQFSRYHPHIFEEIDRAFTAIAEDAARYVEGQREEGSHVTMVSEVLFSASHQQKRMIDIICQAVAVDSLPIEEVICYLNTGEISEKYEEYADMLYALDPYIHQMIQSKDNTNRRQVNEVKNLLYMASSRLDGIIFSCDSKDTEAMQIITDAEEMSAGNVFGRKALLDPKEVENYYNTIDNIVMLILKRRISPQIMELKCYFDRSRTKPNDLALTANSTTEEIARSLLPVVEFFMIHYKDPDITATMRRTEMQELLACTAVLSFNAYVPFLNSNSSTMFTSRPFYEESGLYIEEIPTRKIGQLVARQPRHIAQQLAKTRR